MFFIFGIDNKEKILDFEQYFVCRRCGKCGKIIVYISYSCLSLFFIPAFKWGKRYIARTDCCGGECELDADTGKKILRGEKVVLDADALCFSGGFDIRKKCSSCGYEAQDTSFEYCPKCGMKF